MVYYNVQGATEAELRSSLDALRPNAEDAYTAWRITWTWPQDGTGICHLADVTVSYLVTVTFPRWQPPETAPSTLIEKWVSYTRALADHEKGHVDFVVANVPVLIDSIHRATCDTANLAAEAILDHIREDDLDYDLHTDHGATQGARFP